MRRIGTAVLGVALVAAVAGIGARSFIVTDAAALVTGPGALEQTAAAAIAARFPSHHEMFGNVRGAPQEVLIAPNPKRDGQLGAIYPCAGNVVFAPHDCFTSEAKPKAVVAPPQTPAAPPRQAAVAPPRPAPVTAPPRETVERTPVAARIAPVTPPESCRQNLPAATARMERILAQLKTGRAKADACASYRASFFEMVQVRDVTALCKTGGDRNVELTRIDTAVDTINAAIAQSCDSI